MDFTYSDEQDALRESVRGLVGKQYADHEQRRRVQREDPGFDEKLWTRLAEMGVLGLPFAEDDGGVGAGPVEIAVVAQELGRVVAPEPFLPAVVLAGGLVAALGTPEQRGEVLGALAAGERVVAPALDWPGQAPATVTATSDGEGWRLEGTREPVPHGARADQLVVAATLPEGGGTGVFLVDAEAERLTRTGFSAYDGSRAARVDLAGTPATLLGEPGDRSASIATMLDVTRVMACNDAIGAMEVALAMTTDYLRSRKQFGVPLATFQALTFRAADMYVSLELATSLTQWATMVLDAGDPAALADAAARAALQVSRAGRHIGQEAIQLHGGIGMTAEYAVGSYTAHLTALDHWLGDGQHHLETLVAGVADHADLDPLA